MRYSILLGAAVSLMLAADSASAQYPNGPFTPGAQPYYKPPVSPYLNLLRPGNTPGFNYATQVQPQLQFTQGIQGLQKQYGMVQQTITTLEQQAQQGPPVLPVTGHPVGFMTHKIYFMNLAGAGAGGAGAGGAGAGAAIGGTGTGGVGTGGMGLNTGGAPKKK